MSSVIKEITSRDLLLPVNGAQLLGDLILPHDAAGLVIFAHGSGSSRKSSRNRFVARLLHEQGLGTLLFDLLTEREGHEERFSRHLRFDINLLASRLAEVSRLMRNDPESSSYAQGFFGASTGAAAALVASVQPGVKVNAIVSRGGRPDLGGPILKDVTAPTRLIVGGADYGVIELNREAFDKLRCEKDLVIIPGATHLFEEPGTLEQAANFAAEWFTKHL